MIKNIVFDIGDVLADNRLKEFLLKKGFDGTMIKRIVKASVMSPYWKAFERRELTEDEALNAFASIDPEIKNELFIAYNDIHGMLTLCDYAIDWVKELKQKGFKVFYLSNYSEKAFNECNDSLDFMEFMDGGMLSFQVGMTKPDPTFYAHFLKHFSLKADECIFIDDTKENVDEAIRQGFNGIVFSSKEETMNIIQTLTCKD